MKLTISLFHLIFVWTIIEKEYTLCTVNVESPVNNIPESVSDRISKSAPNHAKEIIRKFGNILRKEYINRNKIEFGLEEEIPEFNLSPMTSFSKLRLEYSRKSDYTNSVFNEYTCSSKYIQVTISTLLAELRINGFVNTILNESTHNIKFRVSLGDALIKNVRSFPVTVSNETSQVYGAYSETNIEYTSLTPFIEANNHLAPIILPWISDLIIHVKSHLHKSIERTLSEKINSDLSILEDFECSILRMDIFVTTLNKDYIINDQHTEKSETHSISVGPAVLRGFSNVTRIKWEFGWSLYYEFYQKTVIDVGPLYGSADWSIISSKKNQFNSTNDFCVNNIRLIGSRDTNRKRYFEVEVETGVTERSQVNLAVDDVIVDNVNKLISNSVENCLKN